MATKAAETVSVDLPVSAVRMLDTADNATQKDWISPEFFSMASAIALNLITAATVVGWVDATQAQELTKAVSALIAAVSAISVNGFVVWKYLAGRTELQSQKLQAQYRYLEVAVTEQLMAQNRTSRK